jgi:hypothetical protein
MRLTVLGLVLTGIAAPSLAQSASALDARAAQAIVAGCAAEAGVRAAGLSTGHP